MSGSAVGSRTWVIAEGYIPGKSTGPERAMTSHETACILNYGDEDAHVELTVFYNDREPSDPYRMMVPARRTLHVRFNDLRDPDPARHRLRHFAALRRPHRRPAHEAGLTASGERALEHHRVFGTMITRSFTERRRRCPRSRLNCWLNASSTGA